MGKRSKSSPSQDYRAAVADVVNIEERRGAERGRAKRDARGVAEIHGSRRRDVREQAFVLGTLHPVAAGCQHHLAATLFLEGGVGERGVRGGRGDGRSESQFILWLDTYKLAHFRSHPCRLVRKHCGVSLLRARPWVSVRANMLVALLRWVVVAKSGANPDKAWSALIARGIAWDMLS